MALRFGCTSSVDCGACACVDPMVYRVGPERSYATLQELISSVTLGPCDIVEVDGDTTYPGDVTFDVDDRGAPGRPVTIRGIRVNGRRPVISGGTNTVAFKTAWPYSGPGADHYIFEGFEVTLLIDSYVCLSTKF